MTDARTSSRAGFARRIALLLLCLVAGAAIGFVGLHFTGSSTWFLAVPACVIAGWFAVADPTACLLPEPGEQPRDRDA